MPKIGQVGLPDLDEALRLLKEKGPGACRLYFKSKAPAPSLSREQREALNKQLNRIFDSADEMEATKNALYVIGREWGKAREGRQ